jgi:hypothetical protein
VCGRGEVIEDEALGVLHEAKYLKLDSSKAADRLDWSARLDVHRRLHWTAEWYQAWAENPASVWELTARQIARYEEEIRACPSLAARWFPASPDSSAAHSHAA